MYDELWTAVNMAAAFRCGQRWTLCNAPIRERVMTAQILMREPFTNFWGDDPAAVERSATIPLETFQ